MLSTIVITIILAVLSFIAPHIGIEQWFHSRFIYILIFYLFVNMFIHRLIEMGMRNQREKFVEFYLGTIVVKLLLSLIFIGIFLYMDINDVFLFVINFFVLYLFYTSFEISGIYRKLRRD